MTAPLRSTPHPSSTLSASQTAPVAEFRCLFTHDVKRKQKRWQDGYLKFHTFNNRVMVCDQTRNHIGDTYWKESNELQEGDELSLDRGVLVEVAEAIGITQTDLTPLLKKPKEQTKEPPTRPTPSATVRPFQRPTSVAPSNAARAATQLRHKSLNALLGTPKGPAGKATPIKSPYESRKEKEKENEVVEERTPKRQKLAPRSTAWRASSPIQGDDSSPTKPIPLGQRTVDARNPSAAKPHAANVIIIPSESDLIPLPSSGVTLPDSPAKAVTSTPIPPATSAPLFTSPVRQEPLPVQTPKIPRAKIPLPKPKPIETPKQPTRASSPPVSASNRLTNVDFAVQSVQKPQKPQRKPSPPPSSPRNPKARSLRLSAGVKRATLLCQSMPQPAPRASNESRASLSKASVTKTSRIVTKEPSPTFPSASGNTSQADVLSNSRTSPQPKRKRKLPDAESKVVPKKARTPSSARESSEDIFDDPEVIHGLMDQQLLVHSSPVESHQPPLSPTIEAPVSKSKAKSAGSKKSKISKRLEADDLGEEFAGARPPASKKSAKKAQTVKKTAEKPQALHTISPSSETVFDPRIPRFKDIAPTHADGSGAQSRNTPTSPTKSVLSTGGFRKKPTRISKNSVIAEAPEIPPPPPRTETVALPPHPLRDGKKGPLMSTTELAALLAKPKKRIRADDPIEDDIEATGKSPAPKIRRVRSENDAPIPSIAEDWEKRNLSKTSSDITEVETVPPPAESKKKVSALAALVKRTDPRKKFQRTQSLGIDTDLPPVELDLPSPVIDNDVGPWSTEAFDLFDWRPPNREEAAT